MLLLTARDMCDERTDFARRQTHLASCEIALSRSLSAMRPSWLERLEERTLPQFNQLVIWSLAGDGGDSGCVGRLRSQAARGPVLFRCFRGCRTPSSRSTATWFALRTAAGRRDCAVARSTRGCRGHAGWLSSAFTGLWSLHVETTYNTAHIFNMANMLLVIQAIWITADAPLIKQRLQGRHVLASAARAAVGFAGIDRLHWHLSYGGGTFEAHFQRARAGPMAFRCSFGRISGAGRGRQRRRLILEQPRRSRRFCNCFTLVLETAGVLAIFPRLRPWIGAGLTAFYAGRAGDVRLRLSIQRLADGALFSAH